MTIIRDILIAVAVVSGTLAVVLTSAACFYRLREGHWPGNEER